MSAIVPKKVVNIKPPVDDAIKPSELITITGHQKLSKAARRAITILWHNAHLQGVEYFKDYTIELAELRVDSHRGNEQIKQVIEQLMTTILYARGPGETTTRRVQFLGGNDMDEPDRADGTLTYSFDKRLVEILADSEIWGRVTLPVLMAFTSKYAIVLYEHLCQWSGLTHKNSETFTIEEFRAMVGVEDSRYASFGDLNINVIKPSVQEINALAPFGLSVVPVKTGRKVTHVQLAWWRKSEDDLKLAYREAQRPKQGRRARLQAEASLVSAPSPSTKALARTSRLAAKKSQGEE